MVFKDHLRGGVCVSLWFLFYSSALVENVVCCQDLYGRTISAQMSEV